MSGPGNAEVHRCPHYRCRREIKWIVWGEPHGNLGQDRVRLLACSNPLAAQIGYLLDHGHAFGVVEPVGDGE